MGKLGDDKEFDLGFEFGAVPQGTDSDADRLLLPAPIRSRRCNPSPAGIPAEFEDASLNTIIEKARNGDLKYLRWLLEFFKPVIDRYSLKFFWMAAHGCEISDLQSVGKVALLASLRSCSEPSKRATFVRYAHIRIQNAIRDFAQDQSSIMSQTRHNRRMLAVIAKQEQEYINRYDKWPTNEELADFSGIKLKTIAELRVVMHSRTIRSMDEPLTAQSGDELSLEEIVPGVQDSDPESVAESGDLPSILAVLTNREREAVELFFGLTGQRKSLRQIAEMHGVTKSAAQQTRDRAIKKLQAAFRNCLKTQSWTRGDAESRPGANVGVDAANQLSLLIDVNRPDSPENSATK